ncbi:MAG: hydantoinase/oxoprolinase N-terminal domain-containing protein, partial [candidate division NC10 bacterium]
MAYRIGVDVGGTFTDFLLRRDGGPARAAKTPSTPADLSEGVLAGLRELAAAEGK